MVPPLPAASRPSKITMTRGPFSLTQSCSAHSLACSRASSFSYFFVFILAMCVRPCSARLSASRRAVLKGPPYGFRVTTVRAAIRRRAPGTARPARASRTRRVCASEELLLEQLLIRRQDLDVAGEARLVARTRQIGRVNAAHQRRPAARPARLASFWIVTSELATSR